MVPLRPPTPKRPKIEISLPDPAQSPELNLSCTHHASLPELERGPVDPFGDASASFDLDALDCPVCKDPLQAPIYQCCNGHYACPGCMEVNKKCITCSKPTGKIRSLGLERIIESLLVRCKFSSNGCAEILKHGSKKIHEQSCLFAPHSCPVVGCDFCGRLKDFIAHFTKSHNASTLEFQYHTWNNVTFCGPGNLYAVLKEGDQPLFLLHNEPESFGNVIYVTSFGSCKEKFSTYQLQVTSGKSRFALESVARTHQGLTAECTCTDFLLVPRHFSVDSWFQFQVEVSIHPPLSVWDGFTLKLPPTHH